MAAAGQLLPRSALPSMPQASIAAGSWFLLLHTQSSQASLQAAAPHARPTLASRPPGRPLDRTSRVTRSQLADSCALFCIAGKPRCCCHRCRRRHPPSLRLLTARSPPQVSRQLTCLYPHDRCMSAATGSAHGTLAGLFARQSSAYAAFRPRYPPQLYQAILRWAGLEDPQQRGLAVDLGCGSGQATADLAALFGRVVGIDASAEQLAHADRRRANVEYRCGPVEATGLPPQSVDLVTAATSLHWWVGCGVLDGRVPVLVSCAPARRAAG